MYQSVLDIYLIRIYAIVSKCTLYLFDTDWRCIKVYFIFIWYGLTLYQSVLDIYLIGNAIVSNCTRYLFNTVCHCIKLCSIFDRKYHCIKLYWIFIKYSMPLYSGRLVCFLGCSGSTPIDYLHNSEVILKLNTFTHLFMKVISL